MRVHYYLWAWSFLWFFLTSAIQVGGVHNVSIANTSPQIVYTPSICNATDPSSSQCNGTWRLVTSATTTLVSTDGPDPQAGNIIPQMFIRFRASALYLSTSPFSNATANLTLSAANVVVTAQINSSIGFVAAVNLTESQVTTLAVTFVSGEFPSRLDIGSLAISVADDNASSSFLPTMSLPPSMSPPAFSLPTSTSTATSSAVPSPSSTPIPAQGISNRRMIGQAVGLVIGLGFGLTFLTGAAFYYRRRRRRRMAQLETARDHAQRSFEQVDTNKPRI